METTRFRYRAMPDHIIEAVQLTTENERDVFEWAPGKQFYVTGDQTDGLTIFCGDGSRRHATHGSWVYREAGTDHFGVCGAEVFADYFEHA